MLFQRFFALYLGVNRKTLIFVSNSCKNINNVDNIRNSLTTIHVLSCLAWAWYCCSTWSLNVWLLVNVSFAHNNEMILIITNSSIMAFCSTYLSKGSFVRILSMNKGCIEIWYLSQFRCIQSFDICINNMKRKYSFKIHVYFN